MTMDREKVCYFYEIIPSTIGEIGLIRRSCAASSLICRILFPDATGSAKNRIREFFPDAAPQAGGRDKIALQIRDFLSGTAVDFDRDDLDFGVVQGFTRRTLQACGQIPRGQVVSYGSLASSLGIPGGARAVGNAMAANPFPLMIPCHRVVRSDGSIGGFGGGVEVKKHLLRLEGIVFDSKGRVPTKHRLEK